MNFSFKFFERKKKTNGVNGNGLFILLPLSDKEINNSCIVVLVLCTCLISYKIKIVVVVVVVVVGTAEMF